eukprot:2981777-Pyramimonas_sp.AAC.1
MLIEPRAALLRTGTPTPSTSPGSECLRQFLSPSTSGQVVTRLCLRLELRHHPGGERQNKTF